MSEAAGKTFEVFEVGGSASHSSTALKDEVLACDEAAWLDMLQSWDCCGSGRFSPSCKVTVSGLSRSSVWAAFPAFTLPSSCSLDTATGFPCSTGR